MRYGGEHKLKRIICIARWLPQDWPEKGPRLLLESVAAFLKVRPDYEAMVIGRGATALRNAVFYPQRLNHMRLTLIDHLPNTELTPLLAESRISLCSSFHESYHIASFEAACCGCSVVALQSPDLPALQSVVQINGTFARTETPEAFTDALFEEARAWDQNARNPFEIYTRFKQDVHVDVVGRSCIDLLNLRHAS
jgi:glycosyltransferase involved in cell wall biosynthesis